MRFLLWCQKTTYLLINRLKWPHHKHIQCTSSHHRPLNPFSIHSHPRIFPHLSLSGLSSNRANPLKQRFAIMCREIHSFLLRPTKSILLFSQATIQFVRCDLISITFYHPPSSIYLFIPRIAPKAARCRRRSVGQQVHFASLNLLLNSKIVDHMCGFYK